MKYKLLKVEQKEEENFIEINSDDLINVKEWGLKSSIFLNVRVSGKLFHRAIWLSKSYDWILGQDDCNQLVLVPLKKENEK